MLRPHCVGPQTHSQETHTLSHSLRLLLSLFHTISLFKGQHQPAPPPPPPPFLPPFPFLSLAPSGLHSYLLTGSESFVTSFQFLTFQLEPCLLPPSANKQENALSEKTVVHCRKSQKRKVGVFDKYILRERPLILFILSPSLHRSPFLPLHPSLFHSSVSLLPFFLELSSNLSRRMIPGNGDFFFFSVFWCVNIFLEKCEHF